MFELPDYHARFNNASANANRAVGQMPQTPPYLDKGKELRMMEGALGGAMVGASAATAMQGPGAPAPSGGAPSMPQPGGFSSPDGSTGVNSGMGSDASMPSPSGPGATPAAGSNWWPKFLGGV